MITKKCDAPGRRWARLAGSVGHAGVRRQALPLTPGRSSCQSPLRSREQPARRGSGGQLGRLGQPAADEPRHRQRGHALRLQHARRCAADPDDERGPQDGARQERLPRPRRQALPLPGPRVGPRGYVTRINLDETDPLKRVTLISDTDAGGNAYPTIDGITWDPFTRQLLLTAESSAPKGGVFAVGLDANGDPSTAAGRRGSTRSAPAATRASRTTPTATSGSSRTSAAPAVERRQGAQQLRLPLPADRQDRPHRGRHAPGAADRAHATAPGHDVQLQSEPVGPVHRRPAHLRHVVRDAVGHDPHRHDGRPFDATAAAKAANATPFKRPENGVFRPGTRLQGVLLHRDR